MGVTFWLGLIALIGIPLLILIYILKPKFQERKISSTYIWKLSLKYRKRRIPIQWLKSLLLIVQCIIVVALTFLIIKPYLKIGTNSNAAYKEKEKVVIIDASASMMAESDGKSRFERAKERAAEIADTASEGKEMTVIVCAKDMMNVVVEASNSPNFIKGKLKSLECTGSNEEFSKALIEAQKKTDAIVTLITDHDFESNGYVNVINVSNNEWNLSILDAWEGIEEREGADTYNGKDAYGETILFANIVSYNRDVTVTPCVDISFKTTAASSDSDDGYSTKVVKNPSVTLKAGEAQGIRFLYSTIRQAKGGRLTSYKSLKFYCLDENGNKLCADDNGDRTTEADAFADDDMFCIYGGETTNYNIYLRGENTDYTNLVLGAVGNCDIDQSKPSQRPQEETQGYDLYVYDNYVPRTLPIDGAVWIINPVPGGNYGSLGFTVGQSRTVGVNAAKRNGDKINNKLLDNIDDYKSPLGTEPAVFSYTRYTESTPAENADSVIIGPNNESLIFAGSTESRVKYVVFSFDLSFTDFPLVFQNFPTMIQNMYDYSLKRTIYEYFYEIGDEVEINVRPDATEVKISVGLGDNIEEFKFTGEQLNDAVVKHTINRGGIYTITQTLASADGTNKFATENFTVMCDENERNFNYVGGTLADDEGPSVNLDGDEKSFIPDYNIIKYIAAVLIVLLLIEWGLQYREQY